MLKTDNTSFPTLLPKVDFDVSCGRYGLKIWSGGFCRFDAQPTNHPHMHETYHELCLVIDGHGEYVHGDERFKLSPGWVFFSEKSTAHEISSYRSRDLHLVFLSLVISAKPIPLSADPFDSVVHRFMTGHCLASGNGTGLLEYVSLLCGGQNTFFDRAKREVAAQLLVLDALDRLAVQKSAPAAADGSEAGKGYVDQAIMFIERNITRPVPVAQIARACGCSERHLRRLFINETGKSLVDAMNERRVNLAAQQLLMRFSVAQVAHSLHIASTAHFSRLFKRYNGMSPKRFQITHAPKPVLPKTVF